MQSLVLSPFSTVLAGAHSALPRSQGCSVAVRLGAQQRRRQRQQWQQPAVAAGLPSLAALPAAASEAFMVAVEAAPSVSAAAEPAATVVVDQAPAAPFASEALAAAQAAAENDPTDLVFSVLFTVAVAALSVVTLGVAYLSFTSWNDSRLEAADRARFDSSTFRPSSNGSTPPKKAAKAAAPPEEFKGFGKK